MSDEEEEDEEEVDDIDMPAIAAVLESTMQELDTVEDWEKIKKIDLARYINTALDCLIDMAHFMVVLHYRTEIIDKAITQLATSTLFAGELKQTLQDASEKLKKGDQSIYL